MYLDGRELFLLASVICNTSQDTFKKIKEKKGEFRTKLCTTNHVQMRTMVQISHMDWLKSVCSLDILEHVSVAVMLKLLKKGKVNDWMTVGVRRRDVVSENSIVKHLEAGGFF